MFTTHFFLKLRKLPHGIVRNKEKTWHMAQGYHWPRLVSYPSLFPKMSMLRYNSMCSYCCLRWLETMASEEDTARQCRCQVGFNQLSGRTELSFLEFSYLHLSGFRKRHLWEFIHCWNQSEAKLEKIFFFRT